MSDEHGRIPGARVAGRRYAGRLAVVTGASSGIGRATARHLVRHGARVIGIARRETILRGLAHHWSRFQGEFVPLAADLTDPDALDRVTDRLLAERPDILINNAGQGWCAPHHEVPAEMIRDLVDLNLQVPLVLMRVTLPAMRERGRGVIVNVASAAGHWSLPRFGVYAATKIALIAASEAAWAENRTAGVHVGVVIPGPVDTPFMSDPRSKGGRSTITGRFKVPPSRVVEAIDTIIRTRRHRIYVPWYHSPIAWIGNLLPGVRRRLAVRLTTSYIDRGAGEDGRT